MTRSRTFAAVALALFGATFLLMRGGAAATADDMLAFKNDFPSLLDAISGGDAPRTAPAGIHRLGPLGEAIPMTDVLPTTEEAAGVVPVLNALRQRVATRPATGSSLEAYIEDLDATAIIDGTEVIVEATDGPAGSTGGNTADITISWSRTRDIDVNTILAYPNRDDPSHEFPIEDASVAATVDVVLELPIEVVHLSDGTYALTLRSAADPQITVDISGLSNFAESFVNVGAARTRPVGTIDFDRTIVAKFDDPSAESTPSPLESLTRDEWTNTSRDDLFDLATVEDALAPVTLRLESDIDGATDPEIVLDAIDDLERPVVPLGNLVNFTNVSGADVLGSLTQLAALLRAAQDAGGADGALPFLDDRIADIVDINDALAGFFSQEPFTEGGDATAFELAEEHAAGFATFDQVADKLEAADGFDPISLVYDPSRNAVLWDLHMSGTDCPEPSEHVDAEEDACRSTPISLGDALSSLGVSLDTEQTGVAVEGTYDVTVPLGMYLDPESESPYEDGIFGPARRTFIQGRDGGDGAFSASVGLTDAVAGPISLEGSIGFLSVRATVQPGVSGGGGFISDADTHLTARRANDASDVTIEGLIRELGAGAVDAELDVDLPRLRVELEVDPGLGSGSNLDEGAVEIDWPAFPDGSPTVHVDAPGGAEFLSDLLPFAYSDDPSALRQAIVDGIAAAGESLTAYVDDVPVLQDAFPLVAASFGDAAGGLAGLAEAELTGENLPTTLQDLEARLEPVVASALGTTAGDLLESFTVVENSPVAINSAIDITICGAQDEQNSCDIVVGELARPISLAADLGEGVLGISSDGALQPHFKLRAYVPFGIELPTVTMSGAVPQFSDDSPRPFVLNTLSVRLVDDGGFGASLVDGSFQATLGPLPLVEVRTATADEAKGGEEVPLTFDVDVAGGIGPDLSDGIPPTTSDDRVYLDAFPAFATTHLTPDLTGDASVTLPVFLGGTHLGSVVIAVPEGENLFDIADNPGWIDTSDLDVPEDFAWGLLSQGVTKILDLLEGALAEGAGPDIPFLDDLLPSGETSSSTSSAAALSSEDAVTICPSEPPAAADDEGGGVIAALRDRIERPISCIENAIDGVRDPADVARFLRDFIDTEHEGYGLHLADSGVQLAATDVEVVCTNVTDCTHGFESVELRIHLGRSDDGFDIPAFDVGVPGLSLEGRPSEGDAGHDVELDWSYELGMRLDKTNGFSLLTDAPRDALCDPERRVELAICASVAPPDATGTLGFAKVAMTNGVLAGDDQPANDTTPDLTAGIFADLDGGTDHQLFLHELTSIGVPRGGVQGTPDADTAELLVHLDVGVDLDLGVAIAADSGLPRLLADLDVEWGMSGPIDDVTVGDPTIVLRNVTIDLDAFRDDVIGPIVQDVLRYTEPLDPIIDVLTARIPILSDLAELAGEDAVTLISMMNDDTTEMIERIIRTVRFARDVTALFGEQRYHTLEECYVVVGPESECMEASAAAAPERSATAVTQRGIVEDVAAAVEGTGFAFPILSGNSAVQLLLGQDVDIVTWEPGRLAASAEISESWPIPIPGVPVSVEISASGSVTVEGHFKIGYNTRGIRQAVASRDASRLLQGLYLDDFVDGREVPEIKLTGTVGAGVSLNAVVLKVGLKGGLRASVGFDLHDGGLPELGIPGDLDGRVFFSEIADLLAVEPVCVFDTTGQLDAFLKAFIKLGVCPICKTFSHTLVEATLARFDLTSDRCREAVDDEREDPPQLAHIEPGREIQLRPGESPRRNVLVIHAGPLAGRRHFLTGQEPEEIVVRQVGEGRFTVSGLGMHQTFGPLEDPDAEDDDPDTHGLAVEAVYANLGSGDDAILLEAGTQSTVIESGGNTNIVPTPVEFSVPAVVCGGSGSDRMGSPQLDVPLRLHGDGSDESTGSGGFGCADGESETDGDDQIAGGTERDYLIGGGGADTIDAFIGDDDVFGGGGDDVITGGPGHDTIQAGGGGDDVAGGPGLGENHPDVADDIFGGEGDDHLTGDDGEDPIRGDGGNDTITDLIDPVDADGGPGNDTIYGGRLRDRLRGGTGNDTIFGSDEVDTIDGGPDNDKLHGENGSDTIRGQAGLDVIVGGLDDTPTTNRGDTLLGGTGPDIMLGDEGEVRPPPHREEIVVDTTTRLNCGISAPRFCEVQQPLDAEIREGDPQSDGRDVMYGDDVASGRDRESLQGDVMYGQGDVDTIYGRYGDDVIHGGPGEDKLWGDKLPANIEQRCRELESRRFEDRCALHDTIFGGPDVDVIAADLGDDMARGGSGADEIYGHTGTDHLYGDGDSDTKLDGQIGDDFVYGGVGNDFLLGGDDRDRVFGEAGEDMVSGGAGADRELRGGDDDDAIAGGDAKFSSFDGVITMRPVDNPADGADQIFGDHGSDEAIGQKGKDHIHGGPGRDELYGGTQSDTIEGDSGDDELYGDSGSDKLYGLTRSTTDDVGSLQAMADNAAAALEGDDDHLKGGPSNDCLKGGRFNDHLEGQGGVDLIEGNDENDVLVGGGREESASGRGKPDTGDYIFGGHGADVLTGDNASVSPHDFDTHTVQTQLLDGQPTRYITLLDRSASPDEGNAGSDRMAGGAGIDHLYGQAETDTITGGSEDDYMEGNQDKDRLIGDRKPEDVNTGGEFPKDMLNEMPSTLRGCMSDASIRDGKTGVHGQDDQVGGSGFSSSDTTDTLEGDGNADAQIGDNGTIFRMGSDLGAYEFEDDSFTIARRAFRSSVGTSILSRRWGSDNLHGGEGDDRQWGQEGNDTLNGDGGNDDMFGELGNDTMDGGAGSDGMVGDRGSILSRVIDGDPGEPSESTITFGGSPGFSFTAFKVGELDRRFDLAKEFDEPMQAPGTTHGGKDTMKGGDGDDRMHGAFGNDLMNGQSDADHMFGGDGGDVMYGGRSDRSDQGADILFGGHGGRNDDTNDADLLDYVPRRSGDPQSWTDITLRNHPSLAQHNQGRDFLYGGFDRDVLQGSYVPFSGGFDGPTPPPPTPDGDWLVDWQGNFNLYTHICGIANPGNTIVNTFHPSIASDLEDLAFAAGAGVVASDVETPGTSAFRELGLVRAGDVGANTASSYPTARNFRTAACQ